MRPEVAVENLTERASVLVSGPHAGAKLFYEPPTTHTRLKDEAGLPLRQMAEKTPELGRNMLVR